MFVLTFILLWNHAEKRCGGISIDHSKFAILSPFLQTGQPIGNFGSIPGSWKSWIHTWDECVLFLTFLPEMLQRVSKQRRIWTSSNPPLSPAVSWRAVLPGICLGIKWFCPSAAVLSDVSRCSGVWNRLSPSNQCRKEMHLPSYSPEFSFTKVQFTVEWSGCSVTVWPSMYWHWAQLCVMVSTPFMCCLDCERNTAINHTMWNSATQNTDSCCFSPLSSFSVCENNVCTGLSKFRLERRHLIVSEANLILCSSLWNRKRHVFSKSTKCVVFTSNATWQSCRSRTGNEAVQVPSHVDLVTDSSANRRLFFLFRCGILGNAAKGEALVSHGGFSIATVQHVLNDYLAHQSASQGTWPKFSILSDQCNSELIVDLLQSDWSVFVLFLCHHIQFCSVASRPACRIMPQSWENISLWPTYATLGFKLKYTCFNFARCFFVFFDKSNPFSSIIFIAFNKKIATFTTWRKCPEYTYMWERIVQENTDFPQEKFSFKDICIALSSLRFLTINTAASVQPVCVHVHLNRVFHVKNLSCYSLHIYSVLQ